MNYIGSKHRLSDFIQTSIIQNVGITLEQAVFCDLFAGTGVVGRSFKPLVKKVIANDLEYYSYVLNKNYIGNHTDLNYSSYIFELNILKGREGFIFNNYCRGGATERQYFSNENGLKIDAVRKQIETWKITGEINDHLYYFLLTSLLEAADKVANTASVYGAYLKDLKKTAQKDLRLEPAEFRITETSHEVFNKDSNLLINEIEGDILYLDPPYNTRQYGANYHILNTIAKYDTFVPAGKTGLRSYKRSDYCKKGEVSKAFEKLIKKAKFKYIFFSYNNEGLMSAKEIESIMKRYGTYDMIGRDYKRFKADKTASRNHKANVTTEYLHILEK